MNFLLLKGYECLTVLLPFILAFVILNAIYNHRKIPQAKGRFFMLLIFSMYTFAVFHFTGIGTLFHLQRYGIELNADQINLQPFSKHVDIIAYLLNILLFVPFGFLLPLIWSKTDGLIYILLSGLSFSLLIEGNQLFNNRRSDIDDLLMNTLGALIGYLMYKLFITVARRAAQHVNHFRYEPAIYILTLFLGHFVMFNEMGFVKILYGF